MGILTGLFSAISGNAAIGWLMRRIPDWGGWLLTFVGGLLAMFMQLDPATQAVLVMALQGNWQEISLGALVGIVPLVFSQWRSWRATVNPHVVEPGKKRRELTEAEARAIVGYDGPIEDRSRR